MSHHIAQINVGRILAPIEDALLAGFVEQLDPVNARADSAPGFVWRLQTDSGNATSIQIDADPRLIVNLSVWESIDELERFSYHDEAHRSVLRSRRRWFERPTEAHTALWWVNAGVVPTVAEALARLAELRARGPTARAFTFAVRFPPTV